MSSSSRQKSLFGAPDAFATEMSKLVNSSELSDLQFVLGEDRHLIYAHRCILAARCEVFRAMFAERSASDDMPFVLSDVQPITFIMMLEFIYTNRCLPTLEQAVDLLSTAVEYGLPELVKVCIRFMTDRLTVENACEYVQAALVYELTDLQSTCKQFIESHTAVVFQSRGFHELSEETMIFVLKCNGLQLDEGEVLKHVKEWASVNSVVTGESLGETCRNVIEHVRFPLLDPDELKVIEKENEKKKYIPVRLISAAWRFHATKHAVPGDPQVTVRSGTLRRPSLQPLGHGL
ncbi:BTB/POZ domain-containing protein 19-like [Sycon ciliatum]|uniref:BTB/POZ domain-containing protein 19-like n=1 Tax=Sycon ciliatum TaxID=27933 RepID=UPI0020ACB86C|eukprot:scpid70226/ scgid17365/ BTB/POZ domain-containing protein 19